MPRSNLSAALIALAAVGVSCGEAHAQAALPGWKIADICAKESAPDSARTSNAAHSAP